MSLNHLSLLVAMCRKTISALLTITPFHQEIGNDKIVFVEANQFVEWSSVHP